MNSIVTAILTVFTTIANWIVETIPMFFELFYVAETGLTLLGSVAVITVGIGIVLLLVGIIQRFLKFRG